MLALFDGGVMLLSVSYCSRRRDDHYHLHPDDWGQPQLHEQMHLSARWMALRSLVSSISDVWTAAIASSWRLHCTLRHTTWFGLNFLVTMELPEWHSLERSSHHESYLLFHCKDSILRSELPWSWLLGSYYSPVHGVTNVVMCISLPWQSVLPLKAWCAYSRNCWINPCHQYMQQANLYIMSIMHWKVAGVFCKQKGMAVNWYWPKGVTNATTSSSSGTCQ